MCVCVCVCVLVRLILAELITSDSHRTRFCIKWLSTY